MAAIAKESQRNYIKPRNRSFRLGVTSKTDEKNDPVHRHELGNHEMQ